MFNLLHDQSQTFGLQVSIIIIEYHFLSRRRRWTAEGALVAKGPLIPKHEELGIPYLQVIKISQILMSNSLWTMVSKSDFVETLRLRNIEFPQVKICVHPPCSMTVHCVNCLPGVDSMVFLMLYSIIPSKPFREIGCGIMRSQFPQIWQRFQNAADSLHRMYGIRPPFGVFWNFCLNSSRPGVKRVFCQPHIDAKNVALGLCMIYVYDLPLYTTENTSGATAVQKPMQKIGIGKRLLGVGQWCGLIKQQCFNRPN
ncbi:hypothetical protein K435DRAFT_808819 [Dendrothele bispora CBS 962.96]|uniref:Uncharacterized protein n=1 Tax=Dendrothele bispora (strain CBS 962.96) TaxID=1314807 RepID=A0A4V4HC36_DENBC|nr:hypothetical protein K435DRAFT_808819 [Dendrothele bispora CBS 962.96]